MKDSLAFRFDRYLKLLRNEIKFNHRGVFIVTGGLFVALTLLSFVVSERVGSDGEFMNIWYALTLIFGGFIYTSIAFRELNQPHTTHLYLMTPASVLEKFLVKWTLTTVGFIVFHFLVFNLFALIAQGVDNYDGYTYFKAFEPFGFAPRLFMAIYFALSSIRLLGAVTYKKYEYFKTDIVGVFVGFAMLFIFALLFRVIFNDFFNGWEFSPRINNVIVEPDNGAEHFFENMWEKGQYILWIGLPILFWTVGFFKLKETEA